MLEVRIRQIRRRLILFRVLDFVLRAMTWASMVALVCVAVLKFVPPPVDSLQIALGILVAAVLGAVVAALSKRITPFQAALAADETLALRERLSSAWLLRGRAPSDPAVAALMEDAEAHAARINPASAFQFRFPRMTRWMPAALIAMVAVYSLVEQRDLFASDEPEEPRPAVANTTQLDRQVAAQRIEKVAEEAKRLGGGEAMGQIAQDLQRLSADVELGAKNSRQAAAEMSRVNDEIQLQKRELEKRTEPFRGIQGLQRAEKTRELRLDLKNNDFSSASSRLEEMAKKLEKSPQDDMTPLEKEQLAQELKDLAKQLRQDKETSEALLAAANALEQAAQPAPETPSGTPDGSQQQPSAGSPQSPMGEPGLPSPLPGMQAAQALRQASDSLQQQQRNMEMINRLDQLSAQAQQARQQLMQQGQGQQQKTGSGQQQPQQGQQSSGQQQAGQQGQQQQGGQQQGGQQGQRGQQQQQPGGQGQQQGQQGGQQQQDGGAGNQSGPQGQQGSQDGSGGQGQGQTRQQGDGANTGQSSQCQGQGDGQCQGQGGGQRQGQGQGKHPGQGQFSPNFSPNEGRGSGPGGRGRGGNVPDDGSLAIGFVDSLIQGEKNENGEIIAVIEIDAPAPVGESNVRYQKVFNAFQQRAADTMRNDTIPASYRDAVRGYFQAINPEQRTPRAANGS